VAVVGVTVLFRARFRHRSDTNSAASFFLRAGSAFENRDGSTNVILDVLPVNGKLNIRDPKPNGSSEE